MRMCTDACKLLLYLAKNKYYNRNCCNLFADNVDKTEKRVDKT